MTTITIQVDDYVKVQDTKTTGIRSNSPTSNPFSIVMQLLNNPAFMEGVNKAGYQIDTVAVLKAAAEAAGMPFNDDFVKKTKTHKRQ